MSCLDQISFARKPASASHCSWSGTESERSKPGVEWGHGVGGVGGHHDVGEDAGQGRPEPARHTVPVAPTPERILDAIRAIPPDYVRTYGDLSPGAPRFAGTVLARGHPDDVPWYRVVRADGSLAKGARQRALLEAEGVPFRGDRVDMAAARLEPWLGP